MGEIGQGGLDKGLIGRHGAVAPMSGPPRPRKASATPPLEGGELC